MTRPLSLLWSAALVTGLCIGSTAWAQDDEPEMTFDEDDVSKEQPEPEAPPEPDAGDPSEPDLPEPELPDEEGVKEAAPLRAGDTRVSWQDIVVVVRKPFLKVGRVELLPQWGVTMNDNIIQHVQFSGALNYFLTDVLAVGLEGQYYVKNLREPFDLVARQARRLPTVNKYNYGAALNFHYVPIYGKFAILDEHIIHWESFFTAGVGFTQSEVVPRDPAFQGFTNFLVTPNVGASMRFFITKFLTVNLGVRDYVFIDKYEPVNRGMGMNESADEAKDNADSSLVNNIVFQAGLSFWFPMSFEYTTFR
jgi:outer membrane beta-barrel protein